MLNENDAGFYEEIGLLFTDRTRRELLRILVKSNNGFFNRSSLLKRFFSIEHSLTNYTFNVLLSKFEEIGYIRFGESIGRYGCKQIFVLEKGIKRFELTETLLNEMNCFLLEKPEVKRK